MRVLFSEVQYARDRKEKNREWNMKIIEAVSKVDGTEVMNRVGLNALLVISSI